MPQRRFSILSVTLFVLSVAMGSLTSSSFADDAEANVLEGVWVAEKVLSAGKEVPAEDFPFEISIVGERMTFKPVGETRGSGRVHEITINKTKDPATIDITRVARGRATTVLGIYKFDRGKLLICSLRDDKGAPASKRPTSFESNEDNKAELLILKRKPSPKKETP